MKIGIVLPVYNEEKKIEKVLNNLKKTNLPIFIVNDGSNDSTAIILNSYLKKSSHIKLYTHQINLGKGAALKTGFKAAFSKGMDAVIMMDSDGQHEFRDLQQFIDKLETKKYDVILGTRNLHHGVPLIRYLGNKLASVLISVLFGLYVSDILCGFRGVTKKSFEKLNFESSGYGVETEMVVKISKHNLRIVEVPIETIYYDKHKGVTFFDAVTVLFDVLRWRIIL